MTWFPSQSSSIVPKDPGQTAHPETKTEPSPRNYTPWANGYGKVQNCNSNTNEISPWLHELEVI